MKASEEHLLIFERHFSPEKRCRPPLRWGIMPSACFSAPLPRGLVEGASAGQHVAAGAAWVDLPQANPSGRASRERASQYPQRSRPSEQRHNDEQREPRRSLRSSPKDETVGRRRAKIDKWLQPCGLRRSKPKATKPLASWRGTGAVLAWHLQPAAGMLMPSRLARGPWLARSLLRIRYGFPQRPLCDLISVSLGMRSTVSGNAPSILPCR
jgi:hypothetical protein